MINRLFTFIIILSSLNLVSGQKTVKKEQASVAKSVGTIQLGIIQTSLGYETRASPTSTIKIELVGRLVINSSNFNEQVNSYFFPAVSAEARKYYNLSKRVENNKSIVKNSGNFVGLFADFQPGRTTTGSRRIRVRFGNTYAVYARWGLRRVYGEHFHIDLAVGPGLAFEEFRNTGLDTRFDIAIDFRIGYAF